MYRIELASGEETVFRTIEELATAIRNGVVNTRARIYHNASQKWLPIEFHPHYKRALELPASPVAPPVDSGHPRIPDFRSSGPQPAPVPAHSDPVQHEPVSVHQSTAVQHQPSPSAPASPHVSAEPHRAPTQHHHTPVQQHRSPVQPSPSIPIPPPVPSPVLQLTRPTFTPPSAQAIFGVSEVGLALEEPPAPPAAPDEMPPAAPQSPGSWIGGPLKLAVIGVLAIVCTRVVVSAAAPGSESRSLAETAPRPAAAPRSISSTPAVNPESAPTAVMTAGPAFSPAIVTTAQAAQAGPSTAPAAAHSPASRPAPTAGATDSIDAVDPLPTTVDLALPDVPRSDSLARAPTTSDSGAIRRILRAVTSSKSAPINAAQ
jgi:hypothetical protein